jgi:pimeloyl-ACP methyl ester carboxylesterase
MPLYVKGNIKSGVFILFLHGGPGASAFYDEFGSFFSEIESKYAVVYWEQRGSGISQGNAPEKSINIPQYHQDIDKVLALLNYLYNKPKIFLMGHSWGGGLGSSYLTYSSETNFNDIKGWIEIDGLHNVQESFLRSSQFVIDYANQQMQQNHNSDWQSVLNFYASKTTQDLLHYPNTDQHAKYVQKCGGYWYTKTYNYASLNNIFFSCSTGFDFLSNNNYIHQQSLESFLQPYINLNKITIPSLILWGRHDGAIPVELSIDAFNNIGTPAPDKSIFIFENSAHSPYIEEKSLFNQKVIEFVSKYI